MQLPGRKSRKTSEVSACVHSTGVRNTADEVSALVSNNVGNDTTAVFSSPVVLNKSAAFSTTGDGNVWIGSRSKLKRLPRACRR